MRAAGMVFRAQLRRQWRSWLGLCLLIAVISGVVLATATAGRRTDSAFPRFLARHGYGTIVYSAGPLQRLGRLPEVAQVTPVLLPFYGHLRCSCRHPIDESGFTLREVPPGDLRRVVKLVSGGCRTSQLLGRSSRRSPWPGITAWRPAGPSGVPSP